MLLASAIVGLPGGLACGDTVAHLVTQLGAEARLAGLLDHAVGGGELLGGLLLLLGCEGVVSAPPPAGHSAQQRFPIVQRNDSGDVRLGPDGAMMHEREG